MPQRRYGLGDSPDQRQPVRWFEPSVLASAGLEVAFSAFENRNLDRRESFGVTALEGVDSGIDFRDGKQDFWFDFVSDCGDGGNATYSVMHTLLRDQVWCGSEELPRGSLLVLGGDLSYPQASSEEYQYRFVDLFMGANRGTPERTEAIVALPQNHDWYDNLSTFARYFVGDPDRTKPLKRFLDRIPVMQRSTYFAVALPHDWWIIGLDFAFTDDIDRNQFESFVGLAEQVGPQARFILVYPEPFWVKDDASTRNIGRPKRCQRLEARIGIDRIRLRIAGDLHQFSDEVSERGDHLVTCGTGGAFLQPTHTADVQAPKIARLENNDLAMINDPAWRNFVRVRTGESGARAAAKEKALPDSRHYSVETGYRYPLPAVSRAMARQLPFKFGWWNWKFALIIGVVYSLGAWLNGFLLGAEIGEFGLPRLATQGWAGIGGDALNWIGAMILFMPSALLNMLTILVFVAFSRAQRLAFMWIGGLLHSAAHGIAVFLLYWCAIYLLSPDGVKSDPRIVQTVFLIAIWMIVAGAVVGSIIFGTFLLIAVTGFGQHQHEAFAALRVEDYKGFLRFKIDTDGVLNGYFVQIDRVCRQWRKTGNDQTQPVWMPDDGQADMASVKHTFRIERQPLSTVGKFRDRS